VSIVKNLKHARCYWHFCCDATVQIFTIIYI